jgi:hypothetical protein
MTYFSYSERIGLCFHNTKDDALAQAQTAFDSEMRIKRDCERAGVHYMDRMRTICCGPISHLVCADTSGKLAVRPIEEYDGE